MTKEKKKPETPPDVEPAEEKKETKIVNITSASKGRVEKRLDEMEVKIDGIGEILKGFQNFFSEEETAILEKKPAQEVGKPKLKAEDSRFPRLDFFS